MKHLQFRKLSTFLDKKPKRSTEYGVVGSNLKLRNWNPIPLPHGSIPEPKGQDLDYVNVAHSHLIHSDWSKLDTLASGLTPFRVKHILLKTQKDYVLSFEFFKWVDLRNPLSNTLEAYSMILHILTKNKMFKSSELILRKVLESGSSGSLDFPARLFDAVVYSYRVCDSSPRVFDCLFKTYAHLRKFRNATDTFCQMKEFGFLPTVESCNAFLSSLMSLNRTDVVLGFYNQMLRSRISPNVYTNNMVISALCKLGKLEKAVEVFREMQTVSFSPNIVSYNTLISGYCSRGLMSTSMKLKSIMEKNGIQPNVVTYNTLLNFLCKEGELFEASKLFNEMKRMEVCPNIVTYNTLINGYSKAGNSEMGSRLCEEMSQHGIKPDILTYNALILGLCKEGKTKKAAYMVKELDNNKLVPNASTFSALISGQCTRKNSERAFQLYKSMLRSGCHPNGLILTMLMATFINNEDYDEAIHVLKETLKRNIVPDSTVLSDLFVRLHQCGKGEVVVDLCEKMKAKNLLPTCSGESPTVNYRKYTGDIIDSKLMSSLP